MMHPLLLYDGHMSQGKKNSLDQNFYYHWQWKNQQMPKADYVIVDEIQDFDEKEILEFIHATRKCFFFFGDTAQSIYNFDKKTMTIDAISVLTGITISHLYNNYRLPKAVARITQDYVGVDVNVYAEKIYLNKAMCMPLFVECNSPEAQIEEIINIIKANNYKDVGILVPDNEIVLDAMKAFTEKAFHCEFKYNAGYNDKRNKDTLNFMSKVPKIMTYHSAKGLQFETILLPFYKGTTIMDARKSLYVAMTRTYRNLYVLFNGVLALPLRKVPKRLYTRIEKLDINSMIK